MKPVAFGNTIGYREERVAIDLFAVRCLTRYLHCIAIYSSQQSYIVGIILTLQMLNPKLKEPKDPAGIWHQGIQVGTW